jgi:NSS family neurotransmitter:Na+ symporter
VLAFIQVVAYTVRKKDVFMSRVTWGSRVGFIFAVAGSAVGLANIWRFPYIVGANGGSAFIAVYLLCILFIGFPAFMAEILIGRTTQTNPASAFIKLSGKPWWGWIGKMTILTGFIVSAFYSAVAGWILGYLFEAIGGQISSFTDSSAATLHFNNLMQNPWWGVSFHALFIAASAAVLYLGVRNGIERWNKILMPLLIAVLIVLVVRGLMMPNAGEALSFLFHPDWNALTPAAILIALGQSFFTLSIGQGTMVTYGSYLGEKENLLSSCIPVVLMDTMISILSAIAVFTIVFSVGLQPDSGPGLLFHTLPVVFSQVSGGYLLGLLFFFLVTIAALTSEISAMEPSIAYLIDEWQFKRHQAVITVALGALILGIPCALSGSLLSGHSVFGLSILDAFSDLASNILIPLGGLAAVILVGWVWGFTKAYDQLKLGAAPLFDRHPLLRYYFFFCLKFSAPILIIIVFLHALHVFN